MFGQMIMNLSSLISSSKGASVNKQESKLSANQAIGYEHSRDKTNDS